MNGYISVKLFIRGIQLCQTFLLLVLVYLGFTHNVLTPDLYVKSSLFEFPIYWACNLLSLIIL